MQCCESSKPLRTWVHDLLYLANPKYATFPPKAFMLVATSMLRLERLIRARATVSKRAHMEATVIITVGGRKAFNKVKPYR